MEQEFMDAPYYYTGHGQFYSAQLVRSLSELGQTGTRGGPGGLALPATGGGAEACYAQYRQEVGRYGQ
jgi:hypothetical protein